MASLTSTYPRSATWVPRAMYARMKKASHRIGCCLLLFEEKHVAAELPQVGAGLDDDLRIERFAREGADRFHLAHRAALYDRRQVDRVADQQDVARADVL